jgi:hypothetical protein
MTHPDILAALACERVNSFLSKAQAARQASLAHAVPSRARQAGIGRFTALVSSHNAAMAGLLHKLGACLVGRGPRTVEYDGALVIPPGDPGDDQAPQLVSQPC